ncbi:MAG: DUF4238 domain-containing protein [Planctomycetes bacterium]|nr:DUF4238 domain-containing protein [Planctomycetota bacterium]
MPPTSNASEPRRHHYIPQSLLREFACLDQPKRICVYQKADPVRAFKTGILNVACESDYHTIERADGSLDHASIETMMSDIESHQSCWIHDVVARGAITEADRGEVASIISTYRARIPQFKEQVERMHQELLHEVGDHVLRRNPVPFPDDMTEPVRQQLTEMIQEKGSRAFKITISNAKLVTMMMESAFSDKTIQTLGQMAFSLGVVEPGVGRLCVSDCPVSAAVVGAPACHPDMLAPGSPYAEVCLPITRTACIIAQWKDELPPSVSLGAAAVKELNRRTAAMASRFVFAPEENRDLRVAVEQAVRRTAGYGLQRIPAPKGAYLVAYTQPVASGMKLAP